MVEKESDLYFPGQAFGWGQVRSYDSRLVSRDDGSEVVSYIGERWQCYANGPYLYTLTGSPVEIFMDASAKRTFTLVSSVFEAPKDYNATLSISGSGVDEVYTLIEQDSGDVYVFYSMNTAIATEKRGRLKERTSREFQAQVKTGVTFNSYNGSGVVTQLTLPQKLDGELHVRAEWL